MENLIEIRDTYNPFVFFDDKPKVYKIHHDGSHHVGTLCTRYKFKSKTVTIRTHSEVDTLFDNLYFQALQDGLKNNERFNFIKTGILEQFPDHAEIDKFVTEKIKSKIHNVYSRFSRFRKKAYLNRWSYFVTFTYDDNKCTADGFKKKLRKCLANLHTRRGWKYMGVFENAPDTGRLHFHGIVYVPNAEMVGEITEITDYSTAKKCMQTRHENSFFEKRFGRNDFSELNEMELQRGQTLNYILKYIGKSNERICYSRGIPTEIYMRLDNRDIATEMQSFIKRYVLFDDVVDWERDVLRYRYTKQMCFADLGCIEPQYVS